MKHYLQSRKLLLLLTLLFLLIRLPALSNTFLLHDERDIVLSGYSIAKTGHDLTGKTLPLFFDQIAPHNPLGAIYYSAFWSFLIPFKSVILARLPFVLISSLLVILIYELTLLVLGKKNLALLTTILYCFSPWVYHVTRTALDIPVAIVTLAAGSLFYLKRRPWLAYLCFLISIFTYQGFRVLLPFLLIYFELFFLLEQKNIRSFLFENLKNIAFMIVCIILIVAIDLPTIRSRSSQIAILNLPHFADEVTLARNTSSAPSIVKKIFNNKLTAVTSYVLTNFTKGQDMSYLFKQGDYSAINGSISAGQFLFPFLVCYYLGLFALGRKLERRGLYLAGLAFVAMPPALLSLNGVSFSIRSMLGGVGFAYVIAEGMILGWELLRNQSMVKKRIVIGSFAFMVFIALSSFVYNYFARRPTLVGEMFNANEQHLAKFLVNKKDKTYTIYHSAPKEALVSYFFVDLKIDANKIPAAYNANKTFRWESFTFTECQEKKDYRKEKSIIVSDRCFAEADYRKLIAEKKLKKINYAEIPYADYSQRIAYFIFE